MAFPAPMRASAMKRRPPGRRAGAKVRPMFKLGIDIGGTFTDFVLLDTESGRRYVDKVLTTPGDPSVGAMQGVERILADAGMSARALRHVIHGTTLVVNAIIERKG